MKVIINENNEKRLNNFLDFLIHLLGYTLTLFLVDIIFNAFFVDNFVYYFLSAIILSILEKTIKPIIFKLTIPITGVTFGLFYFVINLLMLEIVDVLLGHHFDIYGIFWGLFIAFTISVMHKFIEVLIITPIIRRCDEK